MQDALSLRGKKKCPGFLAVSEWSFVPNLLTYSFSHWPVQLKTLQTGSLGADQRDIVISP